MEQTQPTASESPERDAGVNWPLSRVVAALVLVPSIPMLLASAAALLLFYLAPVRFGNLISRLPGESLIRTILVFAPATLLAVVVLALLYAVDQSIDEPDALSAEIEPGARVVVGEGGRYAPAAVRQTALTLTVIPLVIALMFSLMVWSLSFVSPGRFDRIVEPLPGERYLRALVPVAPWVLFVLVLGVGAVFTVQRVRIRSTRTQRWGQDLLRGAGEWTRWMVSAILAFALPALGVSALALAVAWLRPERLSGWIDKLPFDSLVRIGLLLAPPMLFAVVVLAIMYLQNSRVERAHEGLEADASSETKETRRTRSALATGVLIVGLTFTVSMGVGLLGTIAYLVLR